MCFILVLRLDAAIIPPRPLWCQRRRFCLRTDEADIVSQRITEILAEPTFSFSPASYTSIHRKLFSCRMSATRLKQPLSISSTATIMNWCACLSDAYLFEFVPLHSASIKVQLVNPRKVYCIDTGIQHVLSASIAPDDARAFENMVYLALRRVCRDIFYFDDGAGECDFVPVRKKHIGAPVQATVVLNDESEEREINGVRAAMRALKRKIGWIVTVADEDEISFEEGTVKIVPFHKFKPEETLT